MNARSRLGQRIIKRLQTNDPSITGIRIASYLSDEQYPTKIIEEILKNGGYNVFLNTIKYQQGQFIRIPNVSTMDIGSVPSHFEPKVFLPKRDYNYIWFCQNCKSVGYVLIPDIIKAQEIQDRINNEHGRIIIQQGLDCSNPWLCIVFQSISNLPEWVTEKIKNIPYIVDC